jgi:hypothetical protein
MVAAAAYRDRRELRKQPRKAYGRSAWIDAGSGDVLLECVVYDISDTGAGVKLASDATLPAQFTILFTPADNLAGVVVSFGRAADGSAANLSGDCR